MWSSPGTPARLGPIDIPSIATGLERRRYQERTLIAASQQPPPTLGLSIDWCAKLHTEPCEGRPQEVARRVCAWPAVCGFPAATPPGPRSALGRPLARRRLVGGHPLRLRPVVQLGQQPLHALLVPARRESLLTHRPRLLRRRRYAWSG